MIIYIAVGAVVLIVLIGAVIVVSRGKSGGGGGRGAGGAGAQSFDNPMYAMTDSVAAAPQAAGQGYTPPQYEPSANGAGYMDVGAYGGDHMSEA